MNCLLRISLLFFFLSVHLYSLGVTTSKNYVTNGYYLGSIATITDKNGTILQTNRYLSGGLPQTAMTVNDRFIDNHLYCSMQYTGTHSMGFYDNTARIYDAILTRFTTQDPLSEKYPDISPYASRANNPMMFVDRDGKDVCVLLEQGRLHTALLIQNEDKTWSYYSVNGDGSYSSGSFKGGKHFNDVEIGNWNSPQEFLDSDYNQKLPGRTGDSSKEYSDFNYDQGYIIETSPSQDKSIKEKFKEISTRKYNLLLENCATAVKESLETANISTQSDIDNILINSIFGTPSIMKSILYNYSEKRIPGTVFYNIKFSNPNGKHIHKSK